eukprot:scaffold6918_cov380-Prasinococcus_capsulatus_cf.AAC.16
MARPSAVFLAAVAVARHAVVARHDAAEWVAPQVEVAEACAICGRTYPHEHVRALRSSSYGAIDDSDTGEETGEDEPDL